MTKLKRSIHADDLLKLEVFSDPQILPSGEAFVYVSTQVNEQKKYESHIYFQKLNDKTSPQQWTFGDYRNSHPRVSPNGQQLVFQSTRSGVPQLWLMPISGGEARQITTFKRGATNPEWSKDGKSIIFSASLEKDDDVQNQKELSKDERQKEKEEQQNKPLVVNRLKYKSDAKGFHDHSNTHILRYDIDNSTITQLTTQEADHHFQDISPDGQTILFAGNLNEDADYELINDLYFLDVATKEVTKLTNGKGSYHSARFSPNGEKIACFGHEYTYAGATLTELYVFDTKTSHRSCLSKN